MSLHDNVRNSLLQGLSKSEPATMQSLNESLRLMAKWRSHLLENTIIKELGIKVLNGPVKGLELSLHSIEGCHTPKILGCYEQPISDYITNAISSDYQTVVNVGCAEGYYAIGMARLMPNSLFLAFDINPKAIECCRELAKKNQVADRVKVASNFSLNDLSNLDPKTTLIIVDIEGAEDELLSTNNVPYLKGFDLIVETHEVLKKGLTNELYSRYFATHNIRRIEDDGQRDLANMPDWFFKLSHLDQLLSVWEWREGATPWLIMKSKNR